MQGLYERVFYHPAVSKFYSDEAMINYLLRFETALAQAHATHVIIPNTASSIIDDCCKGEYIDKHKLISDAALGGNLAIPP